MSVESACGVKWWGCGHGDPHYCGQPVGHDGTHLCVDCKCPFIDGDGPHRLRCVGCGAIWIDPECTCRCVEGAANYEEWVEISEIEHQNALLRNVVDALKRNYPPYSVQCSPEVVAAMAALEASR